MFKKILVFLFIVFFSFTAYSEYSIKAKDKDTGKIYFGNIEKFKKPASISYVEVLKSTKEYNKIEKEKIKPGTGKYWILLSQGSDKAVRKIKKVAEKSNIDLVIEKGCLEQYDEKIVIFDITQDVIDNND